MNKRFDVIIIGGGIVGLSVAWQLQKKYPSYKTAILEKEDMLSKHQSGHNSGVIHAGIYYTPGSMKAKFCIEGNKAIREFCDEHGIDYQNVGKLVVATDETELKRMFNLAKRCEENSIRFEILDAEATKKMQPNINSVGSIYSPDTGIVNYAEVAKKFAELFMELGGIIYTKTQVNKITETNSEVIISTTGGTLKAGYLVSCAGLYSDKMVKLSGIEPTFKILPFRGAYYQLSKQSAKSLKHLIYPVPDPKLPFLGVHLTNLISGKVIAGPSAILALAKEGYSWKNFNLKEALDIIKFSGTWKVIFKNFKASCSEIQNVLSKAHYTGLVQKYMPTITKNDLHPYPSGVRAQAVDLAGNFIEDFMFQSSLRMLHVANAPSPAATSSIPIGKYIVQKLEAQIIKQNHF